MAQLINFGVPLLGSELSLQAGRAFAQALEGSTGRPLMLRVVGRYSERADGLADGSLDFGWLPPVEAHQLAAHAGVELLQRFFGTARFVPPDGIASEALAQAMRGGGRG